MILQSHFAHSNMNIGNNNPVPLMKYIKVLESELGLKSKKIYKPLQKGTLRKLMLQ